MCSPDSKTTRSCFSACCEGLCAIARSLRRYFALTGWRYHALVASIALSALGYLAASLWGGWREVLAAVAAVGVTGTAVALALCLANYLLRFLRWQRYLHLLGNPVPWQPSLRIYLSGFALTTTPGKAGEMVRSVFLKRLGMPYSESVAAFFAERFSDLIAVAMIAAIGASTHAAARPLLIGLGVMLIAVLLMLHNVRWLTWVEALGRRIRWQRLRMLVVSSIDVVLQFRRCFAAPVMTASLLIGLVAWGAEAHACYLIATWMGADITMAQGYFIYAFSALVGALSFLPGGLGTTELALAGLLILHGMPEAQAIACTLFVRVVTLWFAVALGLLALPRKLNYEMPS